MNAVEAHYPDKSWERLNAPEKLGWSPEKLKAARDYAATVQTAAVMIIVDGRVLDEWGETAARFSIHSIRKSFLSALYGTPVRERKINLSATMAELGIDDNEPTLTTLEKTATVGDLLKARSGVYHPANYETARAKAARPRRGSHAPGAFWHYNNWDFNTLGTIFEQRTKTNIFSEFKARIADPIGMEDFRVEDGRYVTGSNSLHPAYTFRMTARDMARFGLLFLREGAWRGRPLIPRDWVSESTTSYSDAGNSGGYGYMWWIAKDGKHLPTVRLPEDSYSARGSGGQYILVVPSLDLVIVHRVNTDIRGRQVTARQFGQLVRRVLEAKTTETTQE
ncbi:MAG: serine hydrolase domain-containing protein [Candidatus Binatia bacterium]